MAITKRFKVSFEVTIKLSSEEEAKGVQALIKLANDFQAGKELSHLEFELLRKSLDEGLEGSLETAVRTMIREGIRNELTDDSWKISPANVRVIR